jgi:hypothetical protein
MTGTRLDRDADDVVDVEIGIDRAFAIAHQVAFICLGSMQREAVFARVNGDGSDPELGRRAHNANRDFTAIRVEQALDGPRLGKWIHQQMMIALRRLSDQGNSSR